MNTVYKTVNICFYLARFCHRYDKSVDKAYGICYANLSLSCNSRMMLYYNTTVKIKDKLHLAFELYLCDYY